MDGVGGRAFRYTLVTMNASGPKSDSMEDCRAMEESMKGCRPLSRKIRISKFLFIAVLSLGLVVPANTVWADGETSETSGLAKQSQNPVASLISLPFENNATFNNGVDDDFVNILNIKPVIPQSFSKNWNWIHRVIAPVIYADQDIDDTSANFGLGDINYQGFLSPADPGKLIWGVGPTILIPTGMERFTSDQFAVGPNLVLLAMPGHWVAGVVIGNFWSLGGYNDSENVSQLVAQYFANYNMKKGWYLTTSPVITANWKADSGDKWTVPFGGGVGRVFQMGKQPVNLKGGVYYSVEKPDHASNWNAQVQFTLLFPKKN
jgi:hypothetical protein